MFESPLTCGDGFGGADGVRNVALKLNAELIGLLRDGEVGVARNARLNFDEINAAGLEHADRPATVFGCGDGDGGLILRFRTVEHGTRDDHPRAQHAVSSDFRASVENWIKRTAHIADACDAVGEKKRKDEICSIARGVIEIDVRVHVPEAGDEVLAMSVDHLPLVVGC